MRLVLLSFAAAIAALPSLSFADVPPDIAAAQAKMGHINDSPATAKLWAPLHKPVPADIQIVRDVAYGSDPLQKLDVASSGQGAGKPVLVFVHGGGFTGGDKHRNGEFQYDNIMVWAVQHGFVGVNVNYRLAPKNVYPDANRDVADALRWTKANVRAYGGNADRVFLWGHSAGASLVGIYVSHPEFHIAPGSGLAGAVMTSGMYEAAPSDYFGKDPAEAAKASALDGLSKTSVPLFATRAELDPPPIAASGDTLNKTLCAAKKCATFVFMKQHNHMSQVFSVNTGEEQLTTPLLAFLKEHSK